MVFKDGKMVDKQVHEERKQDRRPGTPTQNQNQNQQRNGGKGKVNNSKRFK
jgi:hypothetical protein